ncbi:MAG: HAD hydrolase family protein [Alysiella sp.]|uniref:KdsC family phosphatase n=1 Tax=Alysiella sp. TaxID=1872483 RepID=UPI0026DBD951|nr:HAD family hydrolase [Alysiella sp.]MDO4434165.1 HAD hydrolase family protein [Alysiella sp.]
MLTHFSDDVLLRARAIKLLLLDVDGVLTSGQLFIGGNGEIIKAFHTLDGHGIRMLQDSGVQTAIITARSDNAVRVRAEQLGITHYFHGVHDKKLAYEQVRELAGVAEHECAMIGDDVIDLPVLMRCGLPIAVASAHDFVKQNVVWVTQKNGGFGAVREVTDLIMYAQHTLRTALDGYLA